MSDDQWFRSVFDGVATGMAVVRLDGHVESCNPALERFLGYSEAELRAMTFADFTHPDDVDADVALFTALAARERSSYQLEKRYIRRDGAVVWGRLSVSLRTTAEGTPTHVVGMVEDVTARHVAETARDRVEERLRMALDAAGMGTWEWDLCSNRITLSEQLERITGLAPGSFGGTFIAIAELVHRDDHRVVEDAIRAAVRDSSRADSLSTEFRVVAADGGTRWVATIGRLFRDPRGRPVRLIGTAHDVTRQRLLEQQLRQAQRMDAMGHLAGGIAHDINNVLTAVKGHAAFLIDAIDPLDRRRADAEEVAAAADRAAALTRQLLAFSRHQVLAPRVVEPNGVVRATEQMLRRLIPAHITLCVSLDESVGAVRVDPGQLEQVIVNLILNACDAMPSGGLLSVETARMELAECPAARRGELRPGWYVALTVRNTGVGMSAATRLRLFEPFFTTKAKGKGTGLGLATVYGIVRQSGGAIDVASEPRGGVNIHRAPSLGRIVRGRSRTRAAAADSSGRH